MFSIKIYIASKRRTETCRSVHVITLLGVFFSSKLIEVIEGSVLLVYEDLSEGEVLYADLYFIGVCAAQVCLQNTIKYRSARSVLFCVAIHVCNKRT